MCACVCYLINFAVRLGFMCIKPNSGTQTGLGLDLDGCLRFDFAQNGEDNKRKAAELYTHTHTHRERMDTSIDTGNHARRALSDCQATILLCLVALFLFAHLPHHFPFAISFHFLPFSVACFLTLQLQIKREMFFNTRLKFRFILR